MSEYREKRTVVRGVPGSRPVVESQYDSAVVHERRGMSGTAVAALIIAVIAAAVVITMLVINSQQRTSDQQLADERARTATAQQQPVQAPQSQQQSPVIVTVPQPQPAVVPAPAPPSQPAAAPAPRTSTEVEIDVTSKLLDDSDLHSYPIDVKVSGGTATLSGQVPSNDLKVRAGKLARSVKGVGNVVNNIVVQL